MGHSPGAEAQTGKGGCSSGDSKSGDPEPRLRWVPQRTEDKKANARTRSANSRCSRDAAWPLGHHETTCSFWEPLPLGQGPLTSSVCLSLLVPNSCSASLMCLRGVGNGGSVASPLPSLGVLWSLPGCPQESRLLSVPLGGDPPSPSFSHPHHCFLGSLQSLSHGPL